VDEDGLCPKGVPVLNPHNVEAWLIYTILLTQNTNPTTELVRFDGQLVRDLCDLLGVMEHRHSEVAGKVLYMTGVVNELRMQARQEDETKRKVSDMRRSRTRGAAHGKGYR